VRCCGTVIAGLPSPALTRLLRLHVALANFPIADVVEARVMLERLSARLAAEHATETDLKAMEAALDGMDHPSVSQETFNELDTQFHVAVAEAGGNRLVADMTIAIRASMHAPILRAYAELDDWQSLANRLRSEHRATFEAIRRRDTQAASDLIDQHIRSAYQSLPALHR
jgi:GntR family transcriptional repressor for pyruvate dehydrogenase complex